MVQNKSRTSALFDRSSILFSFLQHKFFDGFDSFRKLHNTGIVKCEYSVFEPDSASECLSSVDRWLAFARYICQSGSDCRQVFACGGAQFQDKA